MVESRTMMIGDKKYDISRRLNDKTVVASYYRLCKSKQLRNRMYLYTYFDYNTLFITIFFPYRL